MLYVDKNYCNSSYIDRYYKNNLTIDQSKTKINIEDIKEKLNKIIKNEPDIVEKEENYNNFKYTINSSNNKYSFRDEYNRKQDKNIGITNKQESSEYRTFQKYSDTGKNKREKHNLSDKCRIYEYNLRERKILLESFSKPKLLNN
jgi:hypothetical protein